MNDFRGLALLTDLYQLTMAYGYWRTGRAEHEAVFHLFFRRTPFQGGYAIACGLAPVLEYLASLRFERDDLEYLASLAGNDGRPLFERAFVDELGRLELAIDVDAIPEGTAVFAHEPLLRVRGPILQCQLLETALLNLLNFNTLIATKAARVRTAARDDSVLEFGLRRAQGIDGALAASRAAYVGGCDATSNVLAGKRFGIPVRGTHAHSWVMSFESELEAFEAYASALPNNCVFLVDTYDTLEGVHCAVKVARALRERGHELIGIRLDSGELGELSIAARAILDGAGMQAAVIVGSNDLDEHAIEELKARGARICVWGVGTKLVTGNDQAALGGVYKLGAIRERGGAWRPCIKLSNEPGKTSIPGVQQVRRFSLDGAPVGDVIYDAELGCGARATDIADARTPITIASGAVHEDLLVPVMRAGARVYESPPLASTRARTLGQLSALAPGVRRLRNAERYPVGLEARLHELRARLITNHNSQTEAKPPCAKSM